VLGRLEDSPGRQAGRAWAVGFDTSLPWVGAGLSGGAVRLERNGNRWRAAARVSQLRSPVGSVSALILAVGCAWHEWSAGGSLAGRVLALQGTTSQWTPVARLGAGITLGPRLVVCAALQVAPPDREAGCAAIGCETELLPGVRLGAQVVNTTGLGSAVRMGVACGEGAARWLAGFDANTHALSIGLAWQDDRQEVVWGARTHPDLGWSHWWTYTRGPAAPGS
jgi:hypothetical protein